MNDSKIAAIFLMAAKLPITDIFLHFYFDFPQYKYYFVIVNSSFIGIWS